MDVRLPDGRILKNVPEGTTKAQIAAKLGLSETPSPKQDPSMTERFMKESVLPAGEAALSLLTGAVATPISGLAGIVSGGNTDVMSGIQDAMTYEPKTERGKNALDTVTKPLQWYQEGAKKYADAVYRSNDNSPVAGALGETFANALPMMIGGKVNSGKTFAAPEQSIVGKMIPESLPRKMYESAAKWRPSLPESQRNSMTETALSKELMPTSSGVQKVNQNISSLNNEVGKLIDDLTASSKDIPIDDLLRNTEKLKKELGGAQNVDAIKDVATVEEIVNNWKSHPDIKGKGFVSARLAQDLKKNLYEKINWNAKRATGTPSQEQTYKTIARGAKEEIGKLDPQINEINSQLQKLYELEPELERSASRIENLNLFGLDSGVKIAAGGGAGGVKGALLGALLALVELPRTKAKAAMILEKVRKSKEISEQDASSIKTLLMQSAVQSGGTQD